jgi:hypothetical protein
MGFYGKVINYFTKAFSKFKVGNTTLEPQDSDSVLNLTGDNWIVLEGKNNTIEYKHGVP